MKIPPMPSAVWKKVGRGKKEVIDWEATSQRFESALRAIRIDLREEREMHRVASERIASLSEQMLAQKRALEELHKRDALQQEQIERLEDEKVQVIHTYSERMARAQVEVSTMRARMELLLGTVRSLALDIQPALSPPSKIELPWGDHIGDEKEQTPSGPMRTMLVRRFIELWNLHEHSSKTFARMAHEVVAGTKVMFPKAHSHKDMIATDTNVVRYLSTLLGKRMLGEEEKKT